MPLCSLMAFMFDEFAASAEIATKNGTHISFRGFITLYPLIATMICSTLFRRQAPRAMTTVLRRTLLTPTFHQAVTRPSKIIFGNNSEHVASELLLLDTLKQEHPADAFKAMVICGGGDNFMSVLRDPAVESVTCVDMNPHQLALGQLKLAVACSDLSTREALGFLGMNNNVNRVEVYEEVVEQNLSPDTAAIIRQDLMHEIDTGIVHFGPGENTYRHLIKTLEDLGFDRESCWNQTVDLEALKEVCQNGIGTAQEMSEASLISQVFPPELASVYLDVMEHHFFPLICMGLYRNVADASCRNHITAMQILNRYDEESLPEWLESGTRKVLREKQSQVTFVNDSILDVPPAKYELVSTSNIFDWVDTASAAKNLDTIADKFLAPHGYMLVRMCIRHLGDAVKSTKKLRECNVVRPEQLAEVDRVQVFFHQPEFFAALRHH